MSEWNVVWRVVGWSCRFWLGVLCVIGGAGDAHAQQWPAGWPTVDGVKVALRADDLLAQASQQRAALLQLSEMVNAQAGTRQYNGRLTDAERLLLGSYKRAAADIERRTLAGFDPAETQRLQLKSPRAQWLFGSDALARDVTFGRERVYPLLDEKLRATIQTAAEVRRQAIGKQEAQAQAAQNAATERARRKALEPMISLAVPAGGDCFAGLPVLPAARATSFRSAERLSGGAFRIGVSRGAGHRGGPC